MGHLVSAIRQQAVPTARLALQDAHRYLVAKATAALGEAQSAEQSFGVSMKRVRVKLPTEGRPSLIGSAASHNLLEIVNQCATIERLLDALRWIESSTSFAGATIKLCHPSTSSQKTESDDHDLVLELPDASLAKFEVCDVVSDTADGNDKERKDLRSLGVNVDGPTTGSRNEAWPPGRLFLVVSQEFCARLMKPTRHGLKRGDFHYAMEAEVGSTRILEVRHGPAPLTPRAAAAAGR